MNAMTNRSAEHSSEARDHDLPHGVCTNGSRLTELSDRELLASVHTLLGTQRRLTARLIGYLVEIEQRRLHLKAACSSMFDFCIQRLGLSEGEAFRRLAAARLARRFPIVMRLIEKGAVHLSALALAQHHLTEQNHTELLREMSGKTKRAVAELLARRFPKPEVPSVLRKLPAQGPPAGVVATLFESGHHEERAPGRASSSLQVRPAGRIEPLSEARYKVQFTATGVLKDKIERAQNLLRHKCPNGDLAVVMERAIDALLVELEKKTRGKAKHPRVTPMSTTRAGRAQASPARLRDRGAVSRAARREVFARDGDQCSFVDTERRRCSARGFLQIDHIDPRGRGGSGACKNLRILCQAHNRFAAEQIFGRKHIEQTIHLRRQRQQDTATSRLVSALIHLGFREGLARNAIERVRDDTIAGQREATVPQLLRSAILLLTQ